jgi:ABC-type Zn2+ transport system substrate-binding protein/surface adhesin
MTRCCWTHGVGVGLAVHGDGLDAEPLARPHDAAGNLTAVGDQDLVEQLRTGEGDRERERQRKRETDAHRHTDTDTHTQTHTHRHTDTHTHTHPDTDRYVSPSVLARGGTVSFEISPNQHAPSRR